MKSYRLLAAALAAVMVCTALAPMGAAAATTDHGDLSVSVSQADDVIVTVDANESTANATVDVATVDENATYAGAGEYDVADDGTVVLPTPEENVTVAVTATLGNETAETTATLEASEESGSTGIDVAQDGADVSVTVTEDGEGVATDVAVSTVDENASYADSGTHATDENGTLTLSAPDGNESVEVAFSATVGNESLETTATLSPAEETNDGLPGNFGALVGQFMEENASDNESDEPFGVRLAGFVVEHNPGNAPDHAGPPGHAGPPSDDGNDVDDDDEKRQGPPEHAGPPDEDDEDDEEDVEDDGNGGGPPANAGPDN
ncbi:hypothetical protein C477_03779 [Haloterrigena salina JCM 13891]|uniref:Uncharacterized protein n=1 Tax=Haloterrigena salina JCM 13891 TaxID=1227488 RepID=M0CM07_9EURY|nr:hypothetical protein [Haloterrigena salina]ELZ22904.1 hypothetical protein C477_03779 [Haloterrigena salina JCM 13891]